MKLYEDVAKRTGGNIYLGVTGPVRVGKSTFVKRLMEELVLPNIADEYRRERARDELPQSGSGRTILTAEPKFVPEEAVEISPDGQTKLSVRMIDSVGYMIPGALGATEDGSPRMITTPWFDHEIPLTEAAELGTKKVMESHCTVGLVLTCDGSVTDIPRADYVEAERRAIADMQATGKPFLILLNTRQPDSEDAAALAAEIGASAGVSCRPIDALRMGKPEINRILTDLLREFPVEELRFTFPAWFDALEDRHPLRQTLFSVIAKTAEDLRRLSEADRMTEALGGLEAVEDCAAQTIDLGTGTVSYRVRLPDRLFYEILSERSGVRMENDGDLLSALSRYRSIRGEYDRIQAALDQVRTTGYGVVLPVREEVEIQPPELIRKGSACGVRLRATAPSIHLLRADISAELSPMVGGETQTEDLVQSLSSAWENDREGFWQSNLFGKTLYDLVSDGLTGKLSALPEDSRQKVRGALTRIVNEGANGLICLVL
ncbi:MAG: stage IV sporulation protein A [Oscillospiraceae bacterium]|nr:stage IV sporulation protein A [Oscillospiraceae bacterium]